jgi:hypothetical protein
MTMLTKSAADKYIGDPVNRVPDLFGLPGGNSGQTGRCRMLRNLFGIKMISLKGLI